MIRALAIAAVLAGCAAPKIEYVPFETKVPIPVPCAAEIPPEPAWATGGLPVATADNFDLHVDRLIAERLQREGYEKKLKAAVDGCR